MLLVSCSLVAGAESQALHDPHVYGCRHLGARCAPTAKQEDEMADVRWFHWQWVARALGCLPPQVLPETDFHIPGPSSLAHRMIKAIIREHMYWDGASVPECIMEEGRYADTAQCRCLDECLLARIHGCQPACAPQPLSAQLA